jgi:hypothetical protein
MKSKLTALLNLTGVLAVIVANAYVGANGINGHTVGDVSEMYYNLFTPAPYAFGIWGLIFIALAVQAIFLVVRAFQTHKSQAPIGQIGLWLFSANLLNVWWLWAWLSLNAALSVLIMLGILACLIAVILRTNMERWDAPLEIIAFVWWPICLYSGWIAVATVANISAYLAKIGWTGGLAESTWAVLMIAVATALGLFMIFARNMREFAMVVVWALVAIAVRHWGEIALLQYAALAGALVLVLAAGYHGSQNQDTMPHKKLKARMQG